MHARQHHIASLLFALSALSFVGKWSIYLFVAVPEHQSMLKHISSLLSFAFSGAGGARWHFVFFAAMPIVFIVLSVVAWRATAKAWRIPSLASAAGVGSTVAVAVAMSWESALFVALATYLAVFNRDG